jgi:hypothetical protein
MGAAGGGAEAGAPIAGLVAGVDMMRVNSPGPESGDGSGANEDCAAGADCSWARR